MTEPNTTAMPTQDQLEILADSLRREYEPRFNAANMNLSIGRVRSLVSRGIGMEINGDWNSFHSARWSLFRRRWVVLNGLDELESKVRAFLETNLTDKSNDGQSINR